MPTTRQKAEWSQPTSAMLLANTVIQVTRTFAANVSPLKRRRSISSTIWTRTLTPAWSSAKMGSTATATDCADTVTTSARRAQTMLHVLPVTPRAQHLTFSMISAGLFARMVATARMAPATLVPRPVGLVKRTPPPVSPVTEEEKMLSTGTSTQMRTNASPSAETVLL